MANTRLDSGKNAMQVFSVRPDVMIFTRKGIETRCEYVTITYTIISPLSPG